MLELEDELDELEVAVFVLALADQAQVKVVKLKNCPVWHEVHFLMLTS